MKIFVDFDDVLFNTKDFLYDIEDIFKKNGISEKIFRRYYKDGSEKKGDEKVRKYNPKEQIKRIKAAGFETKKAEKEISRLLKHTSKYIFADGIAFLKKLKEEELYIVSFGEKRFQGEKIKNSGIGKYFKKILIVDVSKAVGIKKVLSKKNIEPGEALIFLDDRVKFLRDIKKSYPGMVTFHMIREEGRFSDSKNKYCDFQVKDFNEVIKFIEE